MSFHVLKLVVAFTAYAALVLGNQNRTLEPWAFSPLPVGSIQPQGWLFDAMAALALGLPGNMFSEAVGGDGRKFYSYVRESPWLQTPGVAPSDYSDLNEALPYWFNGIVPMAYSLQDSNLKAQVHQVAQTVLDLQTSDGWIGPEDYMKEERIFWGRYPFFLGLTQLAEANATWKETVVNGLQKFFALAHSMLNNSTGFSICQNVGDCVWGQVRVADLMITIQWLLENNAGGDDAKLLWNTMTRLHAQNQFKWEEWYVDGVYQKVVSQPTVSNPDFGFLHGVNVGQGLKYPAVLRRFTHNDTLLYTASQAVSMTFQNHDSPSGSILGDEIERDHQPYSGSELCTTVETGYSLAYLYQATGKKFYADRAECVYFNALPAQIVHNGWGHQYMDQPNQPRAGYQPGWDVFTTSDSGGATVYGLEPFYPCCTVNFPQGYAKLSTHSWATTGEFGIAHMLLVPSTVSTQISGAPVTITCTTNYPFHGQLEYNISAEADFQLYLRVPEWYDASTSGISVNGSDAATLSPSNETGMHELSLSPGTTTVTYTIGAQISIERRGNGAVSVYVGNVLYGLDVGALETSTLPHSFGVPSGPGMSWVPFSESRDWSYQNTTPWNVAIDPSTLIFHGMGANDSLAADPFAAANMTSTFIEVQGCTVAWPLLDNWTPDQPPELPACQGSKETYHMVPYGALKAHMSELPVMLGANFSESTSGASKRNALWFL
ncbi:hypothetical protein F5Y16DRAFT_395920 [Xylariaceae sp. FL0255]|nr:hypothetical protein F5Y16DRAFT_395920 [Xylariaceae sp. FL0255]